MLQNYFYRKNNKKKNIPKARDVQEQESSKFFWSRIGLGFKFNVKTGVGDKVTISLSYHTNVM